MYGNWLRSSVAALLPEWHRGCKGECDICLSPWTSAPANSRDHIVGMQATDYQIDVARRGLIDLLPVVRLYPTTIATMP